MDRERQTSASSDGLHLTIDRVRGELATTLRREHVGRLAWQLAERPHATNELEPEAGIGAEASPVQLLHHGHRHHGLDHVARRGRLGDLQDLLRGLAHIAYAGLTGLELRDHALCVLDDGQPGASS
jgi:hypothetical protein